MLRSVFVNLEKTYFKRRLATRSGRIYKYIPTPVKSTFENKEPQRPPVKIDRSTAEQLEKLSLVGIEDEKAIQILEEAIIFANQILNVDTSKAKPLLTVLEDESLYLRDDVPQEDVTRAELISQSVLSEENYFVTPVGNLDYVPEEKTFSLPDLKEACKE